MHTPPCGCNSRELLTHGEPESITGEWLQAKPVPTAKLHSKRNGFTDFSVEDKAETSQFSL